MNNTMNLVGEEEYLHHEQEQHNLPVRCCCNGAPNLEKEEWVQQLLGLFEKKVEEVFDRKLIPHLNSSSLPKEAEPSVSRSFRLCLKGSMPDTILTKENIEDQGASLELELCDDTGKRLEEVDSEMQNLKVLISAIDDFKFDDSDNFTVEDFNRHIAIPRADKPALLKGNYEISLNNGIARVCGISFTDNSSSRMSGKFRLGALVIKGLPSGSVVRPAVSEAFQVKEHRLKADQKHPNPLPQADISRLVNITKKGIVYQRAVNHGVVTVFDFLQLYNADAKKLQNILKLTGKKWNETVKNAEACDLTKELYKYTYLDNASGDVLLMNCAFMIESVTFKDQTSQPYESLDQFQKEKVCELRKKAYEQRKELKKVYDATIETPFQASLTNPFLIEQQPAISLSSTVPNVSRPSDAEVAALVGFPSYHISNNLAITATNQGSFGQLSTCFNTGANGGNYTNVAIANNEFSTQLTPDFITTNQDNFQQVGTSSSAWLSQHHEFPDDFQKVDCSVSLLSDDVHQFSLMSYSVNLYMIGEKIKSITQPIKDCSLFLLLQAQSKLEKTCVPMNQFSAHKELTHPSAIIQPVQHQGHQLAVEADNAFSENPNAGSHELNQVYSSDQGTALNPSTDTGGFLAELPRQFSMNYHEYFNWDEELLQLPNPLQEERSKVSACDSITSKLITTCYVTKAAALFMISYQQNPASASASPMKKRKLQ